jgi:Uma2 family endonuclease
MGAAQPHPKYTLAEYLAFEERSEIKHEYLAGQIYAMAGASPAHNRICFNLAGALARRLEGGSCHGYTSDQKHWIEAAELSTYADLTIVCGEPQYHAEQRTLLLNPQVIFEVLSPSTAAYDRGDKWSCYQQLASLTDYLLVSQDRAQIEHYRLAPDGSWRYTRETGLEKAVTIASINGQLPLAEVYSGIEFLPPAPPRPPIQIVSE